MAPVIFEGEILEAEGENVFYLGVEPHRGQGKRLPRNLLAERVDMVQVNVSVTTRPDEFPRFESTHLGEHQRQQGIRGDIEWQPQTHVAGTLVKLAGQAVLRHVKLEKRVAGRQGDPVGFEGIPPADDVAAAVGFFPQIFDQPRNLIHPVEMIGKIVPAPIRIFFGVAPKLRH